MERKARIKDRYKSGFARSLAKGVLQVCPGFDADAFVDYIGGNIRGKGLYQIMDVYSDAFDLHLPGGYGGALSVFAELLGPEHEGDTGMYKSGWRLFPFGRHVERHGPEDMELSLGFIYELTKRFTGEFAVRPLLLASPKKAMKAMVKWSTDPNVHVRRLSSEGVRIRLPWAKRIYTAVEEFKSYKRILTNLKDDGSRYVQRSVGNNLNDLYKEFPEKAEGIVSGWMKGSPSKEALWIIRHGQRSLRKKPSDGKPGRR
jgi:3-methyladenine DNA glycosylase AlkC